MVAVKGREGRREGMFEAIWGWFLSLSSLYLLLSLTLIQTNKLDNQQNIWTKKENNAKEKSPAIDRSSVLFGRSCLFQVTGCLYICLSLSFTYSFVRSLSLFDLPSLSLSIILSPTLLVWWLNSFLQFFHNHSYKPQLMLDLLGQTIGLMVDCCLFVRLYESLFLSLSLSCLLGNKFKFQCWKRHSRLEEKP